MNRDRFLSRPRKAMKGLRENIEAELKGVSRTLWEQNTNQLKGGTQQRAITIMDVFNQNMNGAFRLQAQSVWFHSRFQLGDKQLVK